MPPSRHDAHVSAMSLPELLIVIVVIAVISTIAIPMIIGVRENASKATALDNLSLLNAAVATMATANKELTIAATTGTTDEKQVFDALSTRNATDPGTPYLPSSAKYSVTSATNVHRAIWNGRLFQLVKPGTAGQGIQIERLSGSTNSTNN